MQSLSQSQNTHKNSVTYENRSTSNSSRIQSRLEWIRSSCYLQTNNQTNTRVSIFHPTRQPPCPITITIDMSSSKDENLLKSRSLMFIPGDPISVGIDVISLSLRINSSRFFSNPISLGMDMILFVSAATTQTPKRKQTIVRVLWFEEDSRPAMEGLWYRLSIQMTCVPFTNEYLKPKIEITYSIRCEITLSTNQSRWESFRSHCHLEPKNEQTRRIISIIDSIVFDSM